MKKSKLETRTFSKDVKEPKTENVTQATIINKGTFPVTFYGYPILTDESFNIEFSGSYFDLDFNQLKFSGTTITENNVVAFYQVLQQTDETKIC